MARCKRPIDELIAEAFQGSEFALGRLLSLIEDGGAAADLISSHVFPYTGRARVIGITGAPGAGKSTLNNALVKELRTGDIRVAVLAVDPTSPYSGGAILGDRVRMASHVGDSKVFIRSVATRGHLGGLALSIPQAVRVLDAVGFDWIIIETVGVGQVELAISDTADTTIVVVNPGWGDDVQAAKAGLLEIADLFVINKADRAGAEQTKLDLQQMIELKTPTPTWQPPILMTVAIQGMGIGDVAANALRHHHWMEDSGRLVEQRDRTLWLEVENILTQRCIGKVRKQVQQTRSRSLRASFADRQLDPIKIANEIVDLVD